MVLIESCLAKFVRQFFFVRRKNEMAGGVEINNA